MALDEGPQTRDEWLENNRSIMVQEKFSEEEIFYNQIETRLAFPIELRNEADERLGAAYIACLAQYEAEDDIVFDGEVFEPLTVEHLVSHEGVTEAEAKVIVQMAKEEYE